jgi:hypothetical protein
LHYCTLCGSQIREKYPEAAFIELEPDSSKASKFAIDDYQTAALVHAERDNIERLLAIFAAGAKKKAAESKDTPPNETL